MIYNKSSILLLSELEDSEMDSEGVKKNFVISKSSTLMILSKETHTYN